MGSHMFLIKDMFFSDLSMYLCDLSMYLWLCMYASISNLRRKINRSAELQSNPTGNMINVQVH